MATELKPTDGYHTYGWMRTHLNLKGNDLAAFAIVYSLSQSGAGVYRGGVRYLASWMGCSYNTALHSLKILVAEKLLIEFPVDINGVKFCNYATNYSQIAGVLQNLEGGTAKFGDINRSNTNSDISISKDISISHKDTPAKFSKPTIEEISSYIAEQGYAVDAEIFYDYYEANGWMAGRAKMKDWKATIRNWQRRGSTERSARTAKPTESLVTRNQREMEKIMSRFSPESQEYAQQFMYSYGTHDNK